MNLDEKNLLMSGGDGGDTCHRMYTVFLRTAILQKMGAYGTNDAAMQLMHAIMPPAGTQRLLEVQPGIYVRNPDPNRWYSDPRNTSRDQLTPVICYHSIDGDRENQWELLKACLKRGMFAQNIYPNWVDPRTEPVKWKMPDLINPDLWAIFARTWIKSLWAPLALPFIILGDFFMVLSALFKCFAPVTKDGTLELRWNDPTDVDDDNMNNVLMAAQYNFPTPLSWLARKIYKNFRRKNIGNEQLGELHPIMGALCWYHRGPEGNPEIAEMTRPIVGRY